MDWYEFMRSTVPQEVLEYLPNMASHYVLRVRNGKAAAKSETNETKKKHFLRVVNILTTKRDFLIALLRFRDVELPHLLGRTKETVGSKDTVCMEVFEKLVCFVSNMDVSDDIRTNPDRAKEHELLQAAINITTHEDVGQKVIHDAFEHFEVGYDYGDIPQFYADICVSLNAIADFYLATKDKATEIAREQRKKVATKSS